MKRLFFQTFARSLLTIFFIFVNAAFATATTRALVIGIDNYPFVGPALQGAVNDAEDIASVLAKRGVTDLTKLVESDASRQKVIDSLDQLIERTQKDDLVILTFAGHGVREYWGKQHPPGIKEGDPHEVLLLWDVVLPNAKGNIDLAKGGDPMGRLSDAEINQKLLEFQNKGARVIFLADACHGGGTNRKAIFNDLITPPVYRVAQSFMYGNGNDPMSSLYAKLPTPVDTDENMPNLTYLAAVDSANKAPEVKIPPGSSTTRGALSYAFARVLEGGTKVTENSLVSRLELMRFLKISVRLSSNNQQIPDFKPRKNLKQVIFDNKKDFPNGIVSDDLAHKVENKIYIRVPENHQDLSTVIGQDNRFELRPTTNPSVSSLAFDPDRGTVFSMTGDLIATNVRTKDLIKVAEREYAVRLLQKITFENSRDIHLVDGDRRYGSGEKVVLDGRDEKIDSERNETYYALIDISGNGLVQYLYPIPELGDLLALNPEKPFDQMIAQEPFGTDLLVMLASTTPLDDAIKKLRAIDKQVAPLTAVDIIAQSVKVGADVGIQAIYTTASGK